MTEKRFKMKKLEYESYFIDSQQEYVDEYVPKFKIDDERTMSDSQILDLLNENERLKQFKNKTFDLLNKEITGNEEAIEWGEKQGVDVGAIGFHTNMLKILRKELQRND